MSEEEDQQLIDREMQSSQNLQLDLQKALSELGENDTQGGGAKAVAKPPRKGPGKGPGSNRKGKAPLKDSTK